VSNTALEQDLPALPGFGVSWLLSLLLEMLPRKSGGKRWAGWLLAGP